MREIVPWAALCLVSAGCTFDLDVDCEDTDAPLGRSTCETLVDLGGDDVVDQRIVETTTFDARGRVTGWARDLGADGTIEVSSVVAHAPDGSRTEVVTSFEPDAFVETSDYDAAGHLVRFHRDPAVGAEVLRIFTFDAAGRLVGFEEGSLRTAFVLDPQGLVLSFTRTEGDISEVTTYGYAGDRLIRASTESSTAGTEIVTWAYDAEGRAVRADRDVAGDGDIDSEVHYTYDADGRLVMAAGPAGIAPIALFEWDAFQRLARRTTPNPLLHTDERFSWDETDRLTSYEVVAESTAHTAERFAYADDLVAYRRLDRDLDGDRLVVTADITYDADGNVIVYATAASGLTTYAYVGDCACEQAVLPEDLEPAGPGALVPCATDEDRLPAWRLPTRPEPEWTGTGSGFPYFD